MVIRGAQKPTTEEIVIPKEARLEIEFIIDLERTTIVKAEKTMIRSRDAMERCLVEANPVRRGIGTQKVDRPRNQLQAIEAMIAEEGKSPITK